MIVISACLAGIQCRYDGKDHFNPRLYELVKRGEAILICPEQLGGLPTPRTPAEIKGEQVVNKNGQDVTKQFRKGAKEALKIAKMYQCQRAILKAHSPSCGVGIIYDGSFTGTLVKGNGVTTELFLKAEIDVITERDYLSNQ